MNPEHLAVVLGPIAIGAVLGPLLITLMSKARQRAETENFEVLSDKTRFEAMDLLVTHLRLEVDRLRIEAVSERATATAARLRVTELEDLALAGHRLSVEVAQWSLAVLDLLKQAGLPAPVIPPRVEAFLSTVDYPMIVLQLPKEGEDPD